MSILVPNKGVWDVIIYPFPNFKVAAIEVENG